MDKQTRDKLICEALGLHELKDLVRSKTICRKCENIVELVLVDFDDWSGFGVIMERGRTTEWWWIFVDFLWTSVSLSLYFTAIPAKYINPTPLADKLAEFWEGRKK